MTNQPNQFSSSLLGEENLKLINEIPVNLENVEKVSSVLLLYQVLTCVIIIFQYNSS